MGGLKTVGGCVAMRRVVEAAAVVRVCGGCGTARAFALLMVIWGTFGHARACGHGLAALLL